jgi:2-succinyl-5-enolpyruvyl-6-hydroxy-3-cyclohexene-1-carboxylate synthase
MWELIDQLIQQGVEDFFLAPGSRSTQLAIAIASHPKAKIHLHFDERGLGFYALGCAVAKKKPSAIIVTSGTAVGNLLPAVMEAHHSSTPLILLTADRPPELRESGANQTTNQINIFQNFVRWQFDLEVNMEKKAIRSKAAQAVYRATTPHPGPVQLNCPAREPLYPFVMTKEESSPIHIEVPVASTCAPKEVPPRGLILIGRTTETKAALEVAKKLQWPVFADILSNARLEDDSCQIKHFDWLLTVDCVIHFGERLTSKRLMEWLTKKPPIEYVHVSTDSHWIDPHQLLTNRIHAPISATNFHNQIDANWLKEWKELDRVTTEKFTDSTLPFTETAAMNVLKKMPFDNWAIFLANSMPIREADWFFFPESAKGFYANRGLSGIDGNIATIAGISVGLNSPVFAFIGDLTALHDINSLSLIAKLPVVLLISNNQGGGIFSHLSVATDPNFEKLWAFSHPHNFEHAAKLFSIPYTVVNEASGLDEAVNNALKSKTAHIIEMSTCRKTNAGAHKKLREAVL